MAAEAYAATRLCRALAILDGTELLYAIGLALAGGAAIIVAFERLPARSYATLQSEPLLTERLASGRRRLVRDLMIELDGRALRVPKGTETDFSSIPWFGRSLVRWSKVDIAGVVHDYLYQTHAVGKWQADRAWRRIALSGSHSANRLQAWIAWCALAAFGWWAWRSHGSRRSAVPPADSGDAGDERSG